MSSSFFWNLKIPQGVKYHTKDFPKKIFKSNETYVVVDEELYISLLDSRKARAILSNFILRKWWPETEVQKELRNILNLPVDISIEEVKSRNSDFEDLVLANFRYKCALCGFSASFYKNHFGLDGAPIKSFSKNGPATIENGLSLCKFHHWAFDQGVLSVQPKSLEILYLQSS